MRILIAEDDKDSQKLLARILEKENYEVVITDDGRMAWEIFQREDFRLVITDWIMPRMKGLELCEKIRAKEKPGYVYIILVTSMEEKADLVRALDAGADDYVTKPYDKGELLARVRAGQRYRPRRYHVEPDASNASYFFAAAALTGGRVKVLGLTEESAQGDVRFLDVLQRMGCG